MNKVEEYDEQGIGWIGGKRCALTVTEYAHKHGVTRQTVLSKIKRGVLKAKRQAHSGIWLIPNP